MSRRHRVGSSYAYLAGLAGLLLVCAPPLPAPEVEYSGCLAVSLPGSVCTLYPGPEPQIKLWVKTSPGLDIEIRAGTQRLSDRGKESKKGRRFILTLSPKASRLMVRLRRRDGIGSPAWSLPLTPPEVPDWLSKVNQLNQSGKPEEARDLLTHQRKLAPGKDQGLILHSLASLAHQNGNEEEAAYFLEEGTRIAHDVGLLSHRSGGEVENATMLVAIYLERGRFYRAQQILERLPIRIPADAQYLVAYNRGLLADSVGDYGSALEQLRKAIHLAERVGMDRYLWTAEQVLARILQELGRSQDANDLFTRLKANPFPESPCDLGSLLTNQAWSRLLAREGGGGGGDPTPDLQRAQEVFDRHNCRPTQRLNARLNLALAYQQVGRWPEARQVLAQAKAPELASHATLDQRLWWLDSEGRQAITEKTPRRALDLYDQLSEVAQKAQSLEGRFRGTVGRARAWLALGQPEKAITHFKEADRLIDQQTWHIPTFEGRDTFVAQRELAVRQYLKLLLDRGQREDAFALIRRNRSRLLRQLEVRDRLAHLTSDERAAWEQGLSSYWTLRSQVDQEDAQKELLPGDQLKRVLEDRASQLEQARRNLDRAMALLGDSGGRDENTLSPPDQDEVILAYHPLDKDHWAAFAASAGKVQVNVFELPAGALSDLKTRGALAALSTRLIEPFREVLAGAKRLRVLPYGPLKSIDFHALPLDGEPLIAHHLMVYSLDLPPHPSPTPPGPQMALLATVPEVVTDPEKRLQEAPKEADEVARKIHTWGQGWSLKRLDGRDASSEAIRAGLLHADLFQFTGHAEYSGFAGWDSALLLADGSRLNPGDLLARRRRGRVPAWVVLSTCEGGRSAHETPVEGIGLAQAFLLAGSQAVVAATRPVPDTTARDFIRELYLRWKPGMDLRQAFQQAQLACRQHRRQRNPDDWASFRLFEP